MNDKNDLEHQVHITMKSIHERYVAIDQLVDVMVEKQTRSKPINTEMRLLETAKKEVTAMELSASQAKANYRRTHTQASQKIKTLSAESARLLTSTIKKIEALENATRASQQKLLPQIDKSVRVSQMQKAYEAG